MNSYPKMQVSGALFTACLFAMLGVSAEASACASATQRMREIRNIDRTADTLLLAHRGLWGPLNSRPEIPENSLGSVESAMNSCVDGIEVDVKMTSDGVPVLMHDLNLGRTTNYYEVMRVPKYNPITNQGSNPPVSSVTWNFVKNLKLLYDNRNAISRFTVPSAEMALQLWADKPNPAPIIFDIKTADAVAAVDKLAAKYSSVPHLTAAIKVNASLFPTPADYRRYANNVTAIPVFTTNMLEKISIASSFNAWVTEVGTLEINVKQPNGLLSFQKTQAGQRMRKVAVFHAIPDGPYPNNFYNNTGACCYKLSDLHFTYRVNGQIAGRDTDDRRHDINFLYDQGFGLITTDGMRDDLDFLTRNGRRKTHPQRL
ncbi:glycerophosphodiester phosphodiesterase family protein [Xanthomonas theicola]|uniref:GP-PDE domain-containing protein n=1 Tax=Xanthomonas theicola TaxID=56464 RepID=A0A2S6ZB25_9XANT|nr:glycerophosphodiester phosphodiesterase family protein [Xanthomonas theicola]PPT81826.1 hypothetical protein XthCFBP4691_17845 [Xanthomonas theicola]QNH26082.1 glycerophosphodiester phosphodiesterase family protein [Xanthomonas theicola]